MLSLALCKPKIRKNADVGSLVFGFGALNLDERLIYIAEITEKPPRGEYYRSRKFSNRPDCIYKAVSGTPRRKANARHHIDSDERKKDVGMRFNNAYVLISRNFRYFGSKGTDEYKKRFVAIKRLIENLTQGHRLNHSARVRSELMQLKNEMWKKYRQMRIGRPSHRDRTLVCNQDAGSARCR